MAKKNQWKRQASKRDRNYRASIQAHAKTLGIVIVFPNDRGAWMVYAVKTGRHLLDYNFEVREWRCGRQHGSVPNVYEMVAMARMRMTDSEKRPDESPIPTERLATLARA